MSSQVLSQGASLLFVPFSASTATYKKRQVEGNATELNIMQCLSRTDNKEQIEILKCCSPSTCFTGFGDEAFCLVGFLLIPPPTERLHKHK